MHLISTRNLGVPQSSRGAFQMLQNHGLLDSGLATRMKAMVGFRNIAVHDYQSIDTAILESTITHHLEDFHDFSDAMLQLPS